jgi:hypothetical protein
MKLLELVANRCGSYGNETEIIPKFDYPLVDVGSAEAMDVLLNELQKREYLKKYRVSSNRMMCSLTIAGWEHLEQSKRAASDVSRDNHTVETREFSCISDPALRKVLERDYAEIQRAFNAQCWKSVLILSGGAIEAVLLNLLLQNQSAAQAAPKAPKGKPDISRWDLVDLINVCVEIRLVTNGVEKLSHSVRDYRNLVHPGSEIRNNLTFGAEEAKIALEVLHIVHRDCS